MAVTAVVRNGTIFKARNIVAEELPKLMSSRLVGTKEKYSNIETVLRLHPHLSGDAVDK